MKNKFTDFFYFSRTERNGLLLLVSLSFLFFLSPVIYNRFVKKENVDFSQFEKELQLFLEKPQDATQAETEHSVLFRFDPNTADQASLLRLGIKPSVVQTLLRYRKSGGRFFKTADLKKIYGLEEKTYKTLEPYIHIKTAEKKRASLAQPASRREVRLFPFDPNTIDDQGLRQLGLEDKVIRIWQNFRKKGGRFYKTEEVSKIYGLSQQKYQALKPFIRIEEDNTRLAAKTENDNPPVKKERPTKEVLVDINRSGPEEWQQLKGIGPYRAKMITSYREKLGGFSSIEQVAETYNLPDSVYRKIIPCLQYSPVLKKININSADHKTLAQHPYISFKEAGILVNYRKQHGKFRSEEALGKVKILKPEKIQKLLPYLNFD